jgi:hypothetical protein
MKSLNAGTLSRSEALELESRIRTEHLKDILDIGYRLDDEHQDILWSQGSTTMEGIVNSSGSASLEGAFTLLVVDGDLTVKGSLLVEDDPPGFVVVTGDLNVEGNLLTAGFLEVQGKTKVGGVLVGDYNHGVAKLLGDVTAGAWVQNNDYQLDIEGSFTGQKIEPNTEALGTVIESIRSGSSGVDALRQVNR